MSGAAVLRAWGLALAALAVWFLCNWESQPRRIAEASAPAAEFSAERAETVLARILGPEKPHPVGSAENAAVRARILKELAALGVPARTYRAFTCNPWRKLGFVPCATVTDIIADVMPGAGRAIVLMAHYDSVPAGPGSSDDESGVATVLETVRALKGTKSLHPVLALISDGEEGGLLGANAFLQNAALKARVGAVVNVEARGTKGPSLLFQTSPGDGRLIDLYAHSVPVPATSSLYAEIYKFLPNDTDLTLFIRAGFPSFNFAFADNVRYYHSPLDTRANLAPATLQMQGDNMLGVARALEATPFDALKGGNAVYLSVFGLFLPRLPANYAPAFAIVVFLALAAAAWLAKTEARTGWREVLAAAAMPLLLLVGAGLSGWILAFIAQTLSGHGDPTYAHPLAMRLGLAFAVWSMVLAVSRMVRCEAAAASAWLWLAGLGVVTAFTLPGISPYFVFPAAVAAILLLATARTGWQSPLGQAALCASALAALLIWFPLVVSGETLMGLKLHPLFTLPAAFALSTVVPLLAVRPMSRGALTTSLTLSAAIALAGGIVAGLVPSYSAASPQRVNLTYFEHPNAQARFIADTAWKATGAERIPFELIRAGSFVSDDKAWAGLNSGSAYVSPAGAPRLPLPAGRVIADDGHGAVTLRLTASPAASGMLIRIPQSADLQSLDLRGQHVDTAGTAGDTVLVCLTPDCRTLDLSLRLKARGAVRVLFAEMRYGMPRFGARLQAARPARAMPSQNGDDVVLANTVSVPAH